MFDYRQIFDRRGELYNRATQLCPRARATERGLLIDRLALDGPATICDAPAGGGYLADGLAERRGGADVVVCVEPSAVFARMIDARFQTVISPLDRIALPDGSTDRVASLAGLHHLESKLAFFEEAARVLRPGGRIAAADALDGTPPALFLNGAVNELCETGHEGVFLRPGECTALLAAAGFTDVTEEHIEFTWDFPDDDVMLRYITHLFGLTRGSTETVRRATDRALPIARSAGGTHLGWSLVYATGVKPRAGA